MPIQISNSEPQNSLKATSLNQLTNALLMQRVISPQISSEIRAIIEQYNNQPILLEKLLIQKNGATSIILNNTTISNNLSSTTHLPIDSNQNRTIQLTLPNNVPAAIEKLIQQLGSASNLFGDISIGLVKNQQIVITFAAQENNKQPNLQLIFNKVEISSKGELLLSELVLRDSNQAKYNLSTPVNETAKNNSINTTNSSNIKLVNIRNNIGKIASTLISNTQIKKLNTAELLAQIIHQSSSIKNNIQNLTSSTKVIYTLLSHAEQLHAASSHTDKIENKAPPQNELTSYGKIKDFISTTSIIFKELQKLFSQVEKPLSLNNIINKDQEQNTKNIVSRIVKSGNLFENSLKQRVASNDFFQKKDLVQSNDLIQKNHSIKIPMDSKLILSQIMNQLTKLVAEISNYSTKPITQTQIETAAKQLLGQNKELTPLEKHQIETHSKNAAQKLNLQQDQLQTLIKMVKSLQGSINGSLHQIEQNQLHSLKSEQFNLQQFLVDLPIKQNGMIDSFEMRFESHAKNNQSTKNKYWKVVVRFDLEPLGPMFAEIKFENQKISTHIFAEKKETANLINQYLPTLKKSLFSAGVDVNKVTGSQGNIPENLHGKNLSQVDTHV